METQAWVFTIKTIKCAPELASVKTAQRWFSRIAMAGCGRGSVYSRTEVLFSSSMTKTDHGAPSCLYRPMGSPICLSLTTRGKKATEQRKIDSRSALCRDKLALKPNSFLQ